MKFLTKNKSKGQASLMALVAAVIAIIMMGIVLTVGANITDEIGDTADDGSIAENVSNLTLDALNTFGDWMEIIVIVVIAAFIIALISLFGRGV